MVVSGSWDVGVVVVCGGIWVCWELGGYVWMGLRFFVVYCGDFVFFGCECVVV